MKDIRLLNTLTRKKEKFIPINKGEVGVYSCGPTVYWNQHIGHMYAYVQWDVLVRFLRHTGYKVKWVMNITDVGHMTGDNLGDADTGEDKMEVGAKREGLSVWKLADKYIKQFKDSIKLLNITDPDVLPRATKHIKEQIELVEKIEKNGFTYKTKKGLVFNTAKFKNYQKFARLELKKQKKKDDVVDDPEKKAPWDFFLWVIDDRHLMKWPSPWGEGYPGWHLECTAMSTKYLGKKFDIHTGGIEHIPVHHTNEIAQGHGAFGSHTANYWLHNGWLLEKSGEKMSKSKGGFVTVQELIKKGYDPSALRYLILTSHYSKGLRFSWEALDSASSALKRLREQISNLKEDRKRSVITKDKVKKLDGFQDEFTNALADDLNVPMALSVLWSMLKGNLPSADKYDLAISFDKVLGLKLDQIPSSKSKISKEIQNLVDEREKLRKEKKWKESDEMRKKIEKKGYTIKDTPSGSKLVKK